MDSIALRTLNNLDAPINLAKVLKKAIAWEDTQDIDEKQVRASLWQGDVNHPVFVALARKLREWDAVEGVPWTSATASLTSERRGLEYDLLDLQIDERHWCDGHIPVFKGEPAVVIAEKHAIWYTPDRRARCDFYWKALSGHLRAQGWDDDSAASLDVSSTRVVERFSDPCRAEAHKTKGLVVGYVQSGKTANFTGVIAKAADAGYRLIIVLGGTWDILRSQTQRRLDKEMIGWEMLDGDYDQEPASEQKKFLRHGKAPSLLGYFDWQRLTSPDGDYERLKKGLTSLEFRSSNPTMPFWRWENLKHERARLIVIKKHNRILKRLIDDLLKVEERTAAGVVPLHDVPMLLIDDESDQAGVNTKAPTPGQKQERTAVNGAITKLLSMFPRGQYVGYTATPFANVFIDPDDAEDLFPRDYLLCLPRPADYMGVRDFHDLDVEQPEGMASNERAFIRNVVGADTDEKNLPRAIDAFVLAGAIKLYREAKAPELAKRYRHHTMLVHTNVRNTEQDTTSDEVHECYVDGTYDQPKAYPRLRKLWEEDFVPVALVRGAGLPLPKTFDELKPYIGKATSLIETPGDKPKDPVKVALLVNGDSSNKKDTPDFEHQRIWKIIIGGNKLSRGYTIEGLTISYYRRKSDAADTLMQMGRWFGYRRGYQDLVRIFLGRAEPVSKRPNSRTVDLYRLFEGICRDEEAFRADLKKYATLGEGNIRPIDIPPLVPSHLLRPTSKNKMFNATIEKQNFGAMHFAPTMAPAAASPQTARNQKRAKTLIEAAGDLKQIALGVDGKGFNAFAKPLASPIVAKFLGEYEFSGPNDSQARLVRFLLNKDGLGDPKIDRWLLVMPQIKSASTWKVGGTAFSVAMRSRIDGPDSRFNVYTEPKHVEVAKYLAHFPTHGACVPMGETAKLRVPRQAILLLYPVQEDVSDDVSVGFALVIPENDIKIPIAFSVRVKSKPEAFVVDVPGDKKPSK